MLGERVSSDGDWRSAATFHPLPASKDRDPCCLKELARLGQAQPVERCCGGEKLGRAVPALRFLGGSYLTAFLYRPSPPQTGYSLFCPLARCSRTTLGTCAIAPLRCMMTFGPLAAPIRLPPVLPQSPPVGVALPESTVFFFKDAPTTETRLLSSSWRNSMLLARSFLSSRRMRSISALCAAMVCSYSASRRSYQVRISSCERSSSGPRVTSDWTRPMMQVTRSESVNWSRTSNRLNSRGCGSGSEAFSASTSSSSRWRTGLRPAGT